MKIGVCDDVKECRIKMIQLCNQYFQKYNIPDLGYQVSEFASGEDVLQWKGELDILILDIELEGIDGIKVKEQLVNQRELLAIIFMSNHTEQMIEAFGRNVYGFISKSENQERFFQVLDSVYKRVMDYCMVEVEESGKKIFIRSNLIIRIEVENQYVEIYTKSEKYIKRSSLKDMECLLRQYGFYRLNRKHMINLKYMNTIINKKITLNNGYCYSVAEKSYLRLKKEYTQYVKRNAQ